MKRFLAGVALVALLAGVVWATYTRDASGDGNVMITAAIEYLISSGVTVNAGTNLNTSALATAAKQPSLGTAGAPSANVISVQGVGSGTTLPVTEASAAAMASDLNELTAAPVAKVPVFLAAVVVGTPGTPLVLAADGTFFRTATLQAGRAAAANASLISIGGNTAYTSQRATELAPGETWTITAPAGTKYDLNDFYIDGVNTDDAVRIVYTAP